MDREQGAMRPGVNMSLLEWQLAPFFKFNKYAKN